MLLAGNSTPWLHSKTANLPLTESSCTLFNPYDILRSDLESINCTAVTTPCTTLLIHCVPTEPPCMSHTSHTYPRRACGTTAFNSRSTLFWFLADPRPEDWSNCLVFCYGTDACSCLTMWLPSKEVLKRLDTTTSNAAHLSWSLIRREVINAER